MIHFIGALGVGGILLFGILIAILGIRDLRSHKQ